MNHATRTMLVLLSTVLLLAAGLAAQKTDSAQALLRAATDKALVEGDLNGAIKQYQTIVDKFKSDRAVVATALVRMAECYQKLGDAESRKIYERVVREFTDQKEAAAEARMRLVSLRGAAPSSASMAVRRVWAEPDTDVSGAVSPDGRLVSYTDWPTGDLAVYELTTEKRRRLTENGPAPYSKGLALFSVFSPDSKQLAYGWVPTEQSNPPVPSLWELRVVGIDGAARPRVVAHTNDDVDFIAVSDYSPDRKQVVATVSRRDGTSQIVLVRIADGSQRVLKTVDWRSPERLRFSRDGRYIVYDFPPREDSPDRDIFALATDGSREVTLVEHPANDFVLGWEPDGRNLLFGSSRTGTTDLWALAVSDGKVTGNPALVKKDIGRPIPLGVTGKGSLYYGLSVGIEDVYIATLDVARGEVVSPPAQATQRMEGSNELPAWSPDGRQLAFISGRERLPANGSVAHGNPIIVIRSVETGAERTLVPNLGGAVYQLRWSPDGRSILVAGYDRKGREGLYLVDVQTGGAVPIVQGSVHDPAWFPDGKAIAYRLSKNPGGQSLLVRNLETGQEKEIYRVSLPTRLAISPDGNYLAFEEHGTEGTSWKVVPTEGGRPRELCRTQGARGGMTWTADSRQLLFASGGELASVSIEGGKPRKLGLAMKGLREIELNPDGRRLAFTAGEPKAEVWVMEHFLPSEKTPSAGAR